MNVHPFVIPAKAGTQLLTVLSTPPYEMGPRFRGDDEWARAGGEVMRSHQEVRR